LELDVHVLSSRDIGAESAIGGTTAAHRAAWKRRILKKFTVQKNPSADMNQRRNVSTVERLGGSFD
jgi:hypothetical protein